MLYDLWHMICDMMDEFINCKLGPFETPEAGTCQAFCLVCQAAFVLPAVVLGLFKSLEKPSSSTCLHSLQHLVQSDKILYQEQAKQAKLMCCSLSP